jgi:Spy/CpxP family protein refolding chaperone
MKKIAMVLILAALVAPAMAESKSPYAGQEQRSIKALSDEDIRDLTEARGLGLAKAAELNSYPGPAHVLELADQLELSAAQRTATEALVAAMRDQARPLGAKIIEAERNLDRAFVEGRIDSESLRSQVVAIAALMGELRTLHLDAHIAQRALLAPEQIARYDALRGYRAGGTLTENSPHRH